MALVATKNKYHVALDGQGLVLQGTPDRPAYLSRNAPVYGTRFASGDRDYNDLSQWWYFIQTDWSGGFKDSQSWADDAKFYYSSNIDAYSQIGALKLLKLPSQVFDFTESIKCGVETALDPGVIATSWRTPASTGDHFPPAYSGSLSSWSNPGNVTSSNNAYATASQGNQAYKTKFYNFGFTVPTDAEIVGIETRLEAKYTNNPSGNALGLSMNIYKDAVADGQVEATAFGIASRRHPASPSGLTNSDVSYTRGGSGDLWNTTWTPAEVNATNFGFSVSGSTGSSPSTTDYSIDMMEVRIHYRLGSAARTVYIGTGDENTNSQPVVYKKDGASFVDISTAEYGNSNRDGFVHLAAPFGVLWVHSFTLGDNENDVVSTYTGAAWDDQSASINATTGLNMDATSSRCGVAVGDEYYIFIDNLAEGYGLVKTSVVLPTLSSDYTKVFERARSNEAVIAACEFEGDIYYLVAKSIFSGAVSNLMELRQYDIANDTDVHVRDFKNVSVRVDWGSNNLLLNTGSSLVITAPGREIWELKNGILQRIFRSDDYKQYLGGDSFGNPGELMPWLRFGGVIAENKVWWGNLVYDPVESRFYYSFKGINDEDNYPNNLIAPLLVDSTDTILFFQENDISVLKQYNPNSSSYKTGANDSAFLVFSNHDKLQSIDKLLNKVTIGFELLETGQEIEVYYTTNPVPEIDISEWDFLGEATATLDSGVVFKNLLFPVGTTAKKVWFRVQLKGNGTNTPVLNDLTLEYLPIPDYRKQWELVANMGDEVKNVSGKYDGKTARQLKSRVEQAWITKSALDFQDLDFASTTLRDNPLTKDATVVNVVDTDDFPETGRIRINDEEILYTSKTRTAFIGCTRGARGTLAVEHSGTAQVHNAYRVLVLGIESRAPSILEDKELEYTFALSLREV